ncbi:MAG: DNA polymerase III subunit delta [Firmicutes bacterium]|nr:DNA polymerase III subunit delta [Bacillota bacterium]
MQQLESSLKLGVTCPVYLFWGEETLLLEQAVNRIAGLTLAEGEDWNRELLNGEDADPAAVADLANAASFFGRKRLVVVRGVNWFRPKKRKNAPEPEEAAVDIEPLLAYLKDPNPDTVLILIAQGDVPRGSRLARAVQAVGRAVEFTSPKGGAREQWLKNYLHAAGKIPEAGVVSYMCLMCAEGLASLKSEADKLILYCDGRSRVTQDDAEAIVSAGAAAGVFQLTDQAVARDPAAAVATLRRLLLQGEAEQMLLSLLYAQYRNILLVKDMTARGFSQPQIASTAGINPFVVKKCQAAARAYDYRRLIRALDILLAVDIDVKSGKVEMKDGLELAIMRICAL